MLGTSQSGKSSLIKDLFKVDVKVGDGLESTTMNCSRHTVQLHFARSVVSLTVIDTIGFSDSSGRSNEEIADEIVGHIPTDSNCIFLWVTKVDTLPSPDSVCGLIKTLKKLGVPGKRIGV